MKYFPKLKGERVYLSPINLDDCEIYTKWLNDSNISKYLNIHNALISLASEKETLDLIAKEEFCFAIVRSSDDELLGNIGLHKIDYKSGTAELGIFIGEEENLSKGYGSESIKLLVDFCFKELRLHNIMLMAFAFNERAVKAYTKCGFKEFGRRHEARFHDGKYYDIIYMEIINNKK